MSKFQNSKIIVILNNVRSSENVGAIFRTCDAICVDKIILCGYTPTPLDRFGRLNLKLAKAALGAEKFVAWEKFESLSKAIKSLKNRPSGSQMLRISRLQKDSSVLKVIAIEQNKKAIDYREIKKLITDPIKSAKADHGISVALIFGNEVDGLSKSDLKLCDLIAELPMRGVMVRQARHPRNVKTGKESLNVSVCAGIILYSLI